MWCYTVRERSGPSITAVAISPLLTSPFNTCVLCSAIATFLAVLWCVFYTCSRMILKRRFDNWATFFISCSCLLRHTHMRDQVSSGPYGPLRTVFSTKMTATHPCPQPCGMTAQPTELTSMFSLLDIWPSGASSRLHTFRQEQRIA